MSKLTTDVETSRTVLRPPIKNKNMRTGKYSFTKKAMAMDKRWNRNVVFVLSSVTAQIRLGLIPWPRRATYQLSRWQMLEDVDVS